MPNRSSAATRPGPNRQRPTAAMVRGAIFALLMLPVLAVPAPAQTTNRLPPVLDAMTAPFSDGELAGIGCLVATTVVSGAVVALAGGPAAVAAAVQGPLPPVRVLEGGAALAFLISSACYVGQALAPVAMLGWETATEFFSPPPGR